MLEIWGLESDAFELAKTAVQIGELPETEEPEFEWEHDLGGEA